MVNIMVSQQRICVACNVYASRRLLSSWFVYHSSIVSIIVLGHYKSDFKCRCAEIIYAPSSLTYIIIYCYAIVYKTNCRGTVFVI